MSGSIGFPFGEGREDGPNVGRDLRFFRCPAIPDSAFTVCDMGRVVSSETLCSIFMLFGERR